MSDCSDESLFFFFFFFIQEVPQSPFHVNVDPSHDASKVKAEGPGLAHTGRMPFCTHACASVAELV